ncbi:MAG: hypothetical protein II173_05620 [Firmicutes bacterium]|nr:hypothetical protein [Bacillota bacterium]
MKIDERWIRERLPEDCRGASLDVFRGYYTDGLRVMAEGERGGPDIEVYRAEDEEDLRYWQLEQVCGFAGKTDPPGTWRWYRHHAENGKWMYVERRSYDYNAIEDSRLPDFERLLRNMRYGFPPERWERKVREYVALMNCWYSTPHWDYDREALRFVEISDSKEHDDHNNVVEEPRPGSVIKVID